MKFIVFLSHKKIKKVVMGRVEHAMWPHAARGPPV